MIEQGPNVAELKLTIDRLARKLEFLYRHLRVEYPDESVPLYVLEAQELVRQGRESEAVKIIREQTAVGIIEARAIVEDMVRRVRRHDPGLAAPDAYVSTAVEAALGDAPATATPGQAADQAAVDAAWREAVRAARSGA